MPIFGVYPTWVQAAGTSCLGSNPWVEAVAYIRTSSAANVGPDKDSDKRQRTAIESFAKRAGFALVDEFTDAAVSNML